MMENNLSGVLLRKKGSVYGDIFDVEVLQLQQILVFEGQGAQSLPKRTCEGTLGSKSVWRFYKEMVLVSV